MPTTARDSLRELCGDYFHGLITADAYRQRRATLLNEIVLGIDAPPVPEAERTQERPKAAASGAAVATPASSTPKPALPRRQTIYVGGGLGAVLVFVVAWLFSGREAPPADAPAAPEPASSAAAARVTAAPEESAAFVTHFAQANDWTEDALSAFLFEWDQLSDAQQTSMRQSDPFRAFAQKLRSRILELHALADTSRKDSVERFRLVVSFARELDVDPGVSDVEMPSHKIAKPAAWLRQRL